MVTPLTKNLLGWTDTQNALLFVAIGVTAVVGYGVTIVRKNNFLKTFKILCQKKIQILSKYCEPRMTLLIGVATEVVVVFLLIITLPNATFRLVDTTGVDAGERRKSDGRERQVFFAPVRQVFLGSSFN